MVEVSQSVNLADPGQCLGNKQHSVALNLLELDLEIKVCPEERVCTNLIQLLGHSGNIIEVLLIEELLFGHPVN